MKNSKRPSGQATLFQAWKKSTKKLENDKSIDLFQTWGSNDNTNTQKFRKHNESVEDIINVGDEDDDNELLAAVDKIDLCENAQNSHDVGNLSFSASTNDEGLDVIPGFDCSAGNSWIYPTNYPIRDYQFNIVQKALYHNTLVTLPTGLGKTFIAAVVMYNFYRWYPQGKIIFMAPTKPLVTQQIDACYDIMGIPRQDTAEMTGSMAPAKREQSWIQKRVFFLTPQVFQNDLSRGSCRADEVVCLVFDEAHKALGNYSYCQVVREVLGYTRNFRVLALSATPGDGIKAVQQVISNLLVSHIELRSEDSDDIKPYTHQRQVEKIVVKLGDELEFFKMKYLRVLNIVVSRLCSNQVFWQRNTEKVNKTMLLAAREQFRQKCAAGQQPRHQVGPVEGDFALAISLYHGFDLLLQHGLLPFYNFIKGIADGSKGSSRAKTEISRNPDFMGILEDLKGQIEVPQDSRSSFGSSPKGPNFKPSFIGHPKLVKLRDIVLEHFRVHENTEHEINGSRVMIFSQFRDSVQEISRILSQYKPLVRVMSFVGQQSKGNTSKGLKQKEQLEVIRQFRNGGHNTLVATCVGEEGLDIGEVDLIVCFDASASPIRLVQRMGRTGRKRDGRIIVLVTEGKEEQIYQRSQRNKSSIHKTILESARTLDLYMENPRMVPKNVRPVCQKMFITVNAKSPNSKSKSSKSSRKSNNSNIKKLLSAASSSSKNYEGLLSPQELRYWNDNFRLPDHEAGLTLRPRVSNKKLCEETKRVLSLTEWLEWQTPLQSVHYVNHSKRSRHFAEILEFCDFRRDCGESGDNYDLEMQSYLDRDDIVLPGENLQCGIKKWCIGQQASKRNMKGNKAVIVETDGEEKADNKKEGKATESSRKRKCIDFGSDIDEDFEDGMSGAPEKKKLEDNLELASLGKGFATMRPTSKKQSSHSLTKKQSESKFSALKEKSKCTNSAVKNIDRSEASPCIAEVQSELLQDQKDESYDLSELLDIPSSQRRRKVSRNFVVLPDAPSLDTLLDFNALNTDEEDPRSSQESGDDDFMPSMFKETLEPSKTKGKDNPLFMHPSEALLSGQNSRINESEGDRLAMKEEGISDKLCSSKSSMETKSPEPGCESIGKYKIGKNLGSEKKTELEDETQIKRTERSELDEVVSPVFGSGLVCDATSRDNENDGIDFEFHQEIASSFFDDDDATERALCEVQTPLLVEDDYKFENKRSRVQISESQTTHLSPPTLKAEDVVTNKHSIETPCLFDDDHFENKSDHVSNSMQHLNACTLYSEVDEQPDGRPDRSIHCETEAVILKSRRTERSSSRIQSFSSDAKPSADQAKSLNIVTSETRCKEVHLPNDVVAPTPHLPRSRTFSTFKSIKLASEQSRSLILNVLDNSLHDVVAPTPNRGRFFSSFIGKVDGNKSRSLKSNDSLFSGKNTCDNIIDQSQNKRTLLKLRSKSKEAKKPSQDTCDSSKLKAKDSSRLEQILEASRLLRENGRKEANPIVALDNIKRTVQSEVKRETHLPSSRKRNSLCELPGRREEPAHITFTRDGFADEEESCTLIKPSVPFKQKVSICLEDNDTTSFTDKDGIRKEKSSSRSSPLVNRKALDESNKSSPTDEIDTDVRRDEKDSPLVIARRKLKALRQGLLESDSDEDFEKVASLESYRKGSYVGTKKVQDIFDSDDECDLQENLNLKRKLHGVDGKQMKTMKKKRPLLDDFLDDEAEVLEDDRHISSDESLSNEYEMDDSFIDDRSQLTQRSPLTAMKKKTRNVVDNSVNMMDIYRKSLLTPHRPQLRFQSPAFHRLKNRYKMVYDQLPATEYTSPTTDKDDQHDVSRVTDDDDEIMCAFKRAGPPSVSPKESQIVVRRQHRGKRRVLADSFSTSPEATNSDQQTEPCPSNQSLTRITTRDSGVEVKETEVSTHCKTSQLDDVVFKRPVSTAPMISKVSCVSLGNNENIEGILAAALEDDSDDETLMTAMTSFSSDHSALGKDCVNENSPEIKMRSGNLTRTNQHCRLSANNCSELEKVSQNNSSYRRNVGTINSVKVSSMNQNLNEKRCAVKSSTHLANHKTVNTQPNKVPTNESDWNVQNSSRHQTPSDSISSNFENQPAVVSPLFPPLSTSLKNTHDSSEKTSGQDDTTAVLESSVDVIKKTSHDLTPAQRDTNKLTILVGSKEVSNCQIVSFLRRKHNIKAVVSQITGCDYIVSTRMAVERKSVSDISCQSNLNKLIARVRDLCDLYDRPCIIIEKDRPKNGETQLKCEFRSKYFDRILACLAQTHIKVLFSDSQEDTSDILASLALVEEKKHFAIFYPLPLSKEKEQIVKFLSSIPRTSYITAITLCYHNRTLGELMNSSAEELVKRVRTLSLKRAKDILKFLQYRFCADMVKLT